MRRRTAPSPATERAPTTSPAAPFAPRVSARSVWTSAGGPAGGAAPATEAPSFQQQQSPLQFDLQRQTSKPQQQQGQSAVNLSGLWARDNERSDVAGYEASLDLLGIKGIQRATAKLIDGVEIKQVGFSLVHDMCLHSCVKALELYRLLYVGWSVVVSPCCKLIM